MSSLKFWKTSVYDSPALMHPSQKTIHASFVRTIQVSVSLEDKKFLLINAKIKPAY